MNAKKTVTPSAVTPRQEIRYTLTKVKNGRF
jgi:hypothetical protein